MSMIEFHNVQKYYGKFHALKDINLTIDAGETVVLIGPSGSGKSSLIRTINGLDPIRDGQLIVNGFDLADKKTNVNLIRKDVGMVFQHFNLYNNKSVIENIMLAPRIVLKRPEDENRELAMKLLDKVGLANKAESMPAQLSGGQKQRIAVARALIRKKPLLILDEGTSAIDMQTAYDIESRLLEISDLTLLTITHNMSKDILELYDEIIFMADGKIIEHGTFETLIAKHAAFYDFYQLKK